jgi:hypothetical protein
MADKTNAIPAVETVMRQMVLMSRVVTMDAADPNGCGSNHRECSG